MATICLTLRFCLIAIFAISTTWTVSCHEEEDRKIQSTFRLSRHCHPLMIRLDQYDRVELSSNHWPITHTMIPGNLTCTANYMTENTDHGICITFKYMTFKSPRSGVQFKIYTSRFGPDKAFNYFHQDSSFEKWCTKERIVSLELSSIHEFDDYNDDYTLGLLVESVSTENIEKIFRMDSFKECNVAHVLKSGEMVKVYGQEYPIHADLPSNCQLTFSTSSEEEYEEVCVKMLKSGTHINCLSSLVVNGFNSRFWPATEILGCNDTNSVLRYGTEMCSIDKSLTLELARTNFSNTGMTFLAEVKVKRHPHWELIDQEKSELRGLDFIKGVTYFVATVDTLAGIAAAILTYMFKRPRSFWKKWAETVKIPDKCEPVHYEDSCTAVTSSKIEDIMEGKSY